MAGPPGAIVPRCTYRLQLHREFDLDAAGALLPYLARLGVSHVYCSPLSTARPGSRHGYDVVDHRTINPELGGREGFERFARAARTLGIGLLLDQVPNHMGVHGSANAWWQDVLEHGPASPHASWFDIEWAPPNPLLKGKLLLPILGDQYGAVLERGELVLRFDRARGTLALHYHEHRLPLDPATYPEVLDPPVAAPAAPAAVSVSAELRSVVSALASLPPRDAPATGTADRTAAARAAQQRLAALAAAEPMLAGRIDAAVAALNASIERLDALHARQAYRLAYWRMAASEINYRRFFDINDLAAVRVELPEVFEATQALALDLAADGWVDGLRIDHPDGLHDPGAYFDGLQQGFARRSGPARRGVGSLYVTAEKIVAAYEQVPSPWAIHGTTGYRFAALINGLFVDPRGGAALDRLWRANGGGAAFDQLRFDCKRLAAAGPLRAEVTMLAMRLQRIAQTDRNTRDHGLHELAEALIDVLAAMPVYRTYVGAAASVQDRRFITWAVAGALRRSALADPTVYAFIERCLAADFGGPQAALAVRGFAGRFQQLSAAVAAKGVEDTALYRFHRLVSLNEVGADPDVFGITMKAFHAANQDRLQHWPHTMLASSTHDNKRAEDVRHRINLLSAQPAAWRLAVRRWHRLTRPLITRDEDVEIPGPADRYLLHQTLLGTLPCEDDTLPDTVYQDRIVAYMLKAAREAKLATSWARPHDTYEQALSRFVRAVLAAPPIVAVLREQVRAIATPAAWHSIAATVLKLTVPGVPDLYQGTELIDLSLVDPDNRRPVDFERRRALLESMAAGSQGADPEPQVAAMAQQVTDGRLKLWAIWRLLSVRRRCPALFSDGTYQPLTVRGAAAARVVAFARRHAGGTVIVAVGRLLGSVPLQDGRPAPETWERTTLELPAALAGVYEEVLGVRSSMAIEAPRVDVATLFERLPMVVLLQTPRST